MLLPGIVNLTAPVQKDPPIPGAGVLFQALLAILKNYNMLRKSVGGSLPWARTILLYGCVAYYASIGAQAKSRQDRSESA